MCASRADIFWTLQKIASLLHLHNSFLFMFGIKNLKIAVSTLSHLRDDTSGFLLLTMESLWVLQFSSTPPNYLCDDWRKKVITAVLVLNQRKVSVLLMANIGYLIPVWVNQVLKVHWVQISASSDLPFRQRQNNPWPYWTEIAIIPQVWAKSRFC